MKMYSCLLMFCNFILILGYLELLLLMFNEEM